MDVIRKFWLRRIIVLMCLAVIASAQNRRPSVDLARRDTTVFTDPVNVPVSLQELVALSPADVVTDKLVRVEAALKGDLRGEIAIEELGGTGAPYYPQLRPIKKGLAVADLLDRIRRAMADPRP